MRKRLSAETFEIMKNEEEINRYLDWQTGMMRKNEGVEATEKQLKFANSIINGIKEFYNGPDKLLLERVTKDFEESKHDKGLISGFIKLWNDWYVVSLSKKDRQLRWQTMQARKFNN